MTSNPSISVAGLGKTYRIRHRDNAPTRATEALVRRLRHPLERQQVESFEALRDVSFEIPRGEAVGIVGRNGAGKSTLLKLLTRVTAPSHGRIELYGRVGSLLEVGTGFHPELTGRENIFLNGTLLGMRAKEIRRRFDEIVDFSGVEKFLDTPVKRYSSGMYVRLAFSVAAHLETEILAIDEVLAVGDADFQAKSIAKMRDVAKDGRTVLFVSHQLQTVAAFCTSALYLQAGELRYHGDVEEALHHYRAGFADHAVVQSEAARRPGTGEVRATDVEVTGGDTGADPREVRIRVGSAPDLVGRYFVSLHLNDADGVTVAQCDSRMHDAWFDGASEQTATVTLRSPWLKPGRYSVDVFVCQMGILDAWEGAASFDVPEVLPYPSPVGLDAVTHGLVLADFSVAKEQP